jgi:C4-dicarboxylate-specific signal transduction histidine kinase
MKVANDPTADEISRLNGCINDLTTILALPAIWIGSESSQIIGTLLDALLHILRLDFVFARLDSSHVASPRETVRLAQRQSASFQAQDFGRALDQWLTPDLLTSSLVVPNPVGEGNITITHFRLGLHDDAGILVAGSTRAEFPTKIDMLLLRVAVNQAAIGLQETRLLGEQKRTAAELERRIAERTSQLMIANESLRDEVVQRRRAQEESLALKDELDEELAAMKRLHEFTARLLVTPELPSVLRDVLNESMELQHADFGIVQLFNPVTRSLEIVAQKGFRDDFLAHFKSVSDTDSACGRALQQGNRVIIEDVLIDEGFVSHRQIAASAGFRAVQSTPLFSRTGEPLGMISTHFRQPHRPLDRELRFTDLYATLAAELIERQQAEEALRAAQAQLAHMARMTTLGELAASIAHEVNQPLAAVVTNGDAGLRWLSQTPPNVEEARSSMKEMVRQGHRASDVIAKTRALIKKSPPLITTLYLNQLVEEVLVLTRQQVAEHAITVRTELDADIPSVSGDSVQLQQVLANLILNAIEATIEMKNGARELLLTSKLQGANEVVIAIQDSGIGIDPHHIEELFKPFFTTKASGLGMGLAISRSIIEGHGGRLWATSNEGHGATFQFSLPANLPN